MAQTKGSWKIVKNTDSVDIDQKCLGLCPSHPEISQDVYDKRGLHIQIRHNGDKQAFIEACNLSNLIAAAPDMFEQLQEIAESFDFSNNIEDYHESMYYIVMSVRKILKKASGE